MCANEALSIIKDVSVIGAACVTAYVAIAGLNKWQKELNGRASFEAARDLAKSIYALRDEIAYCRSPFIAVHEFPEDYNEAPGNCTPEDEGSAWAHVYSKRWEPVGKAIQTFDVATIEAEALWGRNVKDKSAALRKSVRSLQVDIDSFIQDKFSGGESFRDKSYAKDVKEGIFNTKPSENRLTIELNAAIEDLESELRPHLSRK